MYFKILVFSNFLQGGFDIGGPQKNCGKIGINFWDLEKVWLNWHQFAWYRKSRIKIYKSKKGCVKIFR